MKYKVKKLDRRFRYNYLYEYAVDFHRRMIGNDIHVIWYNQALQWCHRTWGWSAEVSQIEIIRKYVSSQNSLSQNSTDFPPECNANWSWSNQCDALRIYLASDKELAMFFLVNANR